MLQYIMLKTGGILQFWDKKFSTQEVKFGQKWWPTREVRNYLMIDSRDGWCSVLRFAYFVEDNDSEYVCKYVNIYYTYERKYESLRNCLCIWRWWSLGHVDEKHKKRKDPNRFVGWMISVIRGFWRASPTCTFFYFCLTFLFILPSHFLFLWSLCFHLFWPHGRHGCDPILRLNTRSIKASHPLEQTSISIDQTKFFILSPTCSNFLGNEGYVGHEAETDRKGSKAAPEEVLLGPLSTLFNAQARVSRAANLAQWFCTLSPEI